MKRKDKIIFIFVIIIVIVLIIFGAKNSKKQESSTNNVSSVEAGIKETNDTYIGELSDGTKINTNAKMNQEQDLGNLKLSNIRLTLKNGVTTFRATVTNNGEEKTGQKSVTLKLKDENGAEVVSAKGLIDGMEVGESKELAISITSNYIDSYEYEILED